MAIKAPVKNLYELVVLLRPNLQDDEIDKNISQIESSIKNYGGHIINIDEPLRRKVTHPVKGFKEGFYVSFLFNCPPELPNMLKRTLSISDDVLRYMVVRKKK